MEILLENNSLSAYKEVSHQFKKIQDSVDSVVPDVNEDIGSIVTVEHNVLLKSKDITSTGVLISGEVNISVLYITENEDSVSCIKMTKGFTIEYDIPDVDPKSLAHISLVLSNLESRIINPRKVSITFEITGEILVYKSDDVDEQSNIPKEYSDIIKTKTDSFEYLLPNAICEKTFAINEQFAFSPNKSTPSKIVYCKPQLITLDTQHIGSKIIVKGNYVLSVCFMSEEYSYPIMTDFTSPFSQIIDTGVDSMDNCSSIIQLTSCYFNLVESINGEYALDTELHAVIQITSRKKQCTNYISDTYSNMMPIRNNVIKAYYDSPSDIISDKINVDEKLSVAEECTDILCVFTSINQCSASQNKLKASLHFDILYMNKNEKLCVVRRTCSLESDELMPGMRLIDYSLNNIYIRPNELLIDVKITLDFKYQCFTSKEYVKVLTVELDNENPYKPHDFPSIILVKHEKDSLWDLAKKYHSSIEKINACNDLSEINGEFIMIPKEC